MSHNVTVNTLVALACALTLAGCSIPGKILETFDIERDIIVKRDASQSVIINHKPNWMTRPGTVTPERVVCTEPSPDVATVLARSITAKVAAGEDSAEYAASSSQGLVQLAERTVAVQVLRERMFRACESYANGAITGTTYTLLMNRFDRAMVTVLFGEVMGGAFGRSLAAIGTTTQAAERLVELDKELKDAKKALKEARRKPEPDQTIKELEDAVTEAKAKRDFADESFHTHVAAAAGPIETKAGPETHGYMKDVFKDFVESNPVDDYIAACVVEMERGLAGNDRPFGRYREQVISKLIEPPSNRFSRWVLGTLELFNIYTDVLTTERERTLAAIEGLDRRSALFEHCKENLTTLLEQREWTFVSLKRDEMELKRAELRVREQEILTAAMTQCNKIKEPCNICSPPCNECQEPCDPCSPPCNKCQGPCDPCSPPCNECQGPCDPCSPPCNECQEPCDPCSPPCNECQGPCDPCSPPCNKCKETLAETCMKKVIKKFNGPYEPDTNYQWRPFLGCGSKETLPTFAFDRFKPKIEEAIKKQEKARRELNALVLQEITEDCNCEKEKKNQNIRALNEKKKTLISKSNDLIEQAENKMNEETRNELETLETDSTRFQDKLQTAKADHEREFYQLELRRQCIKAKKESKEYEALLTKIKTETEKLKLHSKKMEKEGATVEEAGATKIEHAGVSNG